MKQQFKELLLASGFTQGGTKTTEDNFTKGTIEIVINETGFEHRKIVAGSVAYRTPFNNAELYQLKQVISGDRGAMFVTSARIEMEDKPKFSAKTWAWQMKNDPNFFDKYELNTNPQKGRLYVEKTKP